MKVCFNKLENSEVNRDIQRLLDRGMLAENIPRTLQKEYGLLTFKIESKIALRIQFFPYHCDKVDKDSLPVVRSGLVFSYYTIHKRLDELLRDASKEKYHIDEDGLVPNILNSFTRVQHKEVLRALPDKVFEESDNVAELNDLSLSRIKFSMLRKILKKFALTDSPQTELQEQERERGSQGVKRANRAAEGVNGGGQSSSGSQDSPLVCQTCGNRHVSTCRATLDGASPCRACGKKGHWDKAPVCKKNGGDNNDTGREEERKERVGVAGSRGESRWVWKKKSPVANTGCSRHLIGEDLEDSIISRRPCEFRYEEASGGEMVCAEEVEASPLLEGVDGEPVCPLLRGAFKSSVTVSLLSVRGCRMQKVDPPFWVEFPGKGDGAVRARLYERDGVHVVRVLSPSSSSPPSESYLSADRKDCVYLTIVSDSSSFVSSGTDEAARERMPDKAKLSISWAQLCYNAQSTCPLQS
uniref:Uncharacterized protein n=1 Tax=Chromera velia CCMP2878 TaxID=1169474 RepID=A0A0G4HMN8_9ALVE|eukprot:Cvel_29216.t1-p1 / transcript=Cvel_29216.t1 / gene=Cvel_29216 / organism=Chromera_velia_CCMP2878 / gene_product=hypothetical protein / transcript_product=hypothetical protein / location=Cvel_scaffold3958:3485-4999(-) / protein_length=468 / sequence_SO=supercontig / SO=protein_coding / is_pseudo=false